MVPYARRSPPRCPIHIGIVVVNFLAETKSDPTSHGARSKVLDPAQPDLKPGSSNLELKPGSQANLY